MQEEGREEAERLLSGLAAQVNEITGGLPILLIREGDPRDELLALIAEDPRISILVLAAAAGGEQSRRRSSRRSPAAMPGASRCP